MRFNLFISCDVPKFPFDLLPEELNRNVLMTTMSFDAISAMDAFSSLCNVIKDIHGANLSISDCHCGQSVIGAMTKVPLERKPFPLVLKHSVKDGGGTYSG